MQVLYLLEDPQILLKGLSVQQDLLLNRYIFLEENQLLVLIH